MLSAYNWIYTISEWCEKHPGLGGWVGAVGAVAAIFLTWGLARAEYMRTRRRDAARIDAEIKRIRDIVDDFESLFQEFLGYLEARDQKAFAFYGQHAGDPQFTSMQDLAELRVNNWPSLDAYASFKRYDARSRYVMLNFNVADGEKLEIDWRKEHDDLFQKLTKALSIAWQ